MRVCIAPLHACDACAFCVMHVRMQTVALDAHCFPDALHALAAASMRGRIGTGLTAEETEAISQVEDAKAKYIASCQMVAQVEGLIGAQP